MDQATQDYLIKLQNPYAKLSVLGVPEESQIWVKPVDFLRFLGECFSSAQFGNKSPAEFKTLALSASRLSGQAQLSVKSRIASFLPPVPLVFNRLGPEQLKKLATTIRNIIDGAQLLNAQTD